MKDIYGIPKRALSSEVIEFLRKRGISEFFFSDGDVILDENRNFYGNGLELENPDERFRSVRKIDTSKDLYTIIETTMIPDIGVMDNPDYHKGVEFISGAPNPGMYNAAIVFSELSFQDVFNDEQKIVYNIMLLKYAVNPPVEPAKNDKPILRRVSLH